MSWLDGYAPEVPVRRPAPSITPIACPKCRSDRVKVRSADRGTSYLQCLACGHGDGSTIWKISVRLRRILIVSDGV